MKAAEILTEIFDSGIMFGYVQGQCDHSDGLSIMDFMASLKYNGYVYGTELVACLRDNAAKGRIGAIRFGREYSPVLYVELRYRVKHGVQELARKLARELNEKGKADEVHCLRMQGTDMDGEMKGKTFVQYWIRLWWD